MWELRVSSQAFTFLRRTICPGALSTVRCLFSTPQCCEVNGGDETRVSSRSLIQASRITCRFHAISLLAKHTQILPEIPTPGQMHVLCVPLRTEVCTAAKNVWQHMPGCRVCDRVPGSTAGRGVQGKQDAALCLLLLPGGLEPATANWAPALGLCSGGLEQILWQRVHKQDFLKRREDKS